MRHTTAYSLRILALVLSLGLLGTACAPAEEPEPEAAPVTDEDEDEPREPGSIAVGLEAESAGWRPWGDTWAPPGETVARAIYDPLMERDEDGTPVPYLAESFEPNDDFTEYTMTLRQGIAFHDGEPLNADAVVVNVEKHREPGSVTAAVVAPIEDVIAEDELTVRFVLDQPHVAFPGAFAAPVQSSFMASPAAIEADTVQSEPVGTGPFVLESWQRDEQMVVTRNENYWQDGLPYLGRIEFRPIPDEDARLQSLFAGDIDVMQTLRQSIIAQARDRAGDFNLYEHIGNDSGATILNTAVPPFDDRRVREAWAYAINQEELIAVLGGTDISPPGRQLFNPESPWFSPAVADVWPSQDLDRAQAALDDYVNDPERSDGEEPGTPVRFRFDTPPDPSLLETSSVYQAQAAQIGMEMSIETVEQAVHIQQAVGEPPEFIGDYQAKIWRTGEELDPDWLVSFFAPGSPLNFTNFAHEEFMGVLLQARATPDFDTRYELYEQAMLIFAEEVPFTLTGHTASLLATTPDLVGFDTWTTPDGVAGVGHPEAVARWTEVRHDQ